MPFAVTLTITTKHLITFRIKVEILTLLLNLTLLGVQQAWPDILSPHVHGSVVKVVFQAYGWNVLLCNTLDGVSSSSCLRYHVESVYENDLGYSTLWWHLYKNERCNDSAAVTMSCVVSEMSMENELSYDLQIYLSSLFLDVRVWALNEKKSVTEPEHFDEPVLFSLALMGDYLVSG